MLIGYGLRTQTIYATVLSRTTGSKDSANSNDPGGMMWENHRVVLPPHSYFSYLPFTSSHFQSRSPALLTSLVKGDTAERIKSNQWTLGTLHEHPYACVAATISPIIGWFTSLILFFFPTAITLISYPNAPGHVPCSGWWFLVRGGGVGVNGWWLVVCGRMEKYYANYQWQRIHAGRVREGRGTGVGWEGVHGPGQLAVFGTLWVSLIIFISSPLTVGTVVHSVSEKKKSTTINSVVFSGASVQIYTFTLNAHFLSFCNFSSRRDRTPTYALAINLAQSRKLVFTNLTPINLYITCTEIFWSVPFFGKRHYSDWAVSMANENEYSTVFHFACSLLQT